MDQLKGTFCSRRGSSWEQSLMPFTFDIVDAIAAHALELGDPLGEADIKLLSRH